MTVAVERVWAIVVTYNPAPVDFLLLLNALVTQVDHIVVVDNASFNDIRNLVRKVPGNTIELIASTSNRGLAAAQNVGLRAAYEHNVSYAILFDQDSIPDVHMVAKLRDSLVKLRLDGKNVAAVGPNYLGVGTSPFRRFAGLAIKRCACQSGEQLLEVDFLIASGCLIALNAFRQVGEMNEQLFVDQVDVEWGIRAREKGYRLVGVCAASMKHRIGDGSRSVFGTMAPLHSPLRHYYIVRNGVWLFTRIRMPLTWRVAGFLNLARRILFFLWFAKPLGGHMRMIARGIVHGAKGRLGPLT